MKAVCASFFAFLCFVRDKRGNALKKERAQRRGRHFKMIDWGVKLCLKSGAVKSLPWAHTKMQSRNAEAGPRVYKSQGSA